MLSVNMEALHPNLQIAVSLLPVPSGFCMRVFLNGSPSPLERSLVWYVKLSNISPKRIKAHCGSVLKKKRYIAASFA
jgi:hypothetical protein